MGGELDDLKNYVKSTKQFSGFKKTVFKWSLGERDDFPRLSVRARRELVGFQNSEAEFSVNEQGVIGGGKHIKPKDVNRMVEEFGDDVVFFDGRNEHEAKIGRFKNAVIPNTNTSRDFVKELESDKYDNIKSKKVIAYCTGGIRCEVITAMMKKRGFTDVYQIDGGIVKYADSYGDDGLWQGSLRVFDKRMTVNFSDHTAVIGTCTHCEGKTANFENCALAECNDLVLICKNCTKNPDLLFHTDECRATEQAKHLAAKN